MKYDNQQKSFDEFQNSFTYALDNQQVQQKKMKVLITMNGE
jgi:hypothetical protein